jgi:hypothetical protein
LSKRSARKKTEAAFAAIAGEILIYAEALRREKDRKSFALKTRNVSLQLI